MYDTGIATHSFLSFPFPWDIFSHPLALSLCVPLALKWVSCKQHLYGSCFFMQSATLCLLIGAFSPLTFKVTIDKCMYLLPFYYLFSDGFCNSFLFISSSFCFSFCGLMFFFCIVFEFLSFWFLWIYCIYFLLSISFVLSIFQT